MVYKRIHYHHSSPRSKQSFLFFLCHKQRGNVQFASTFTLWCPVTAETAKFSFMFHKTATVFKVRSFVERKKASFLYLRVVRDFVSVLCRNFLSVFSHFYFQIIRPPQNVVYILSFSRTLKSSSF